MNANASTYERMMAGSASPHPEPGGYIFVPQVPTTGPPFHERGEGGEEELEYQVTAWRWWVLFVFSFASFLQSLVWFTFSSVPKVAKEYYPGMACLGLWLVWWA
jgi:hypothetical protein